MKYIAAFFVIGHLVLFYPEIYSQNRMDSLDSLSLGYSSELSQSVEGFEQMSDSMLQEYETYVRIKTEEYNDFCDRIKSIWGENGFAESTSKDWVEYADDYRSRSIVDFENGKVTIEITADASQSENPEYVQEQLSATLSSLISSRGKTIEYKSSVDKQEPLLPYPVLEGQLDLSAYDISQEQLLSVQQRTAGTITDSAPLPPKPTIKNTSSLNLKNRVLRDGASGTGSSMAQKENNRIEQEKRRKELERQQQLERKRQEAERKKAEQKLAQLKNDSTLSAAEKKKIEMATAEMTKKVIKKTNPTVTKETTKTGEQVNVISITLDLVEDHIPKRAERYKELVAKYSDKYSVDQPLIYAVMEQESSFNPAARSGAPAYGLMQLVPRSGGRESYKYVFKQESVPTPDYLYEPENNIELGTAYLKLLMTREFAKVTEKNTKMLCAIAAYNTGAGNVSRAIIGSTKISTAIPSINAMSYNELFAHLKSNLPYAETQDYIQKVTQKMTKYIK